MKSELRTFNIQHRTSKNAGSGHFSVQRWVLSVECFLLFAFAVCGAVFSATAADTRPLKVLMVTGGCCHDYENQKVILAHGISARANVEFTIVHEEGPEGKKDKDHKISI